MTDVFSPERRSWIMSRVGGKDTKPELAVRSMIHRMGYRFRLHSSSLPGRPDVVLARHGKVVFCSRLLLARSSALPEGRSPIQQSSLLGEKARRKPAAGCSLSQEAEKAGLEAVGCVGMRNAKTAEAAA